MIRRAAESLVLVLGLGLGTLAGCVPSVPHDPIPESMEFDPSASPPRVPAPIGLVYDYASKKINFAVAGMTLPTDCTMSTTLSQAECEFDHYLETLDGFPTVTPATAPVTAPLDMATLNATNVVVAMGTGTAPAGYTTTSDYGAVYDPMARALTLHGGPHWQIGQTYWVGVRGYGNGVRAVGGSQVVGSPVMALIKQDMSLTCGAADGEPVDPKCPGFVLLDQGQPPEAAPAVQMQAHQLEAIRQLYKMLGGVDILAAQGLPKEEAAVLWSFPIHSNSVAEIDTSPTAGLVPRVTSATQLRIAVQGTVNPATVSGYAIGDTPGTKTVMVLDLDELNAGNNAAGFLKFTASYAGGDIVIDAASPFKAGHNIGIFMRKEITDAQGKPLVPSPIAVLLTLRGALTDAQGKSTISSIADGDAEIAEAGRKALAALFDNAILGNITGGFLTREDLVYTYAFPFAASQ